MNASHLRFSGCPGAVDGQPMIGSDLWFSLQRVTRYDLRFSLRFRAV